MIGSIVGLIIGIILLYFFKKFYEINPYVTLIIGAVCTMTGDRVELILSNPRPYVQITRSDGNFLVSVKSKFFIRDCQISMAIPGVVTRMVRLDPMGEHNISELCVVGPNTINSLNSIEAKIQDLDGSIPGRDAEFQVFYNDGIFSSFPKERKFFWDFVNDIQIRYSWEYQGRVVDKEIWINKNTLKEVDQPDVIFGPLVYRPKNIDPLADTATAQADAEEAVKSTCF